MTNPGEFYDDEEPKKPVLPPISLIERNLPRFGVDLYVGDKRAPADPALMAEHNITMVLNCAVNLDFHLVAEPDPLSQDMAFGTGYLRYHKLGIVDGPGNPAQMLLAGYFQLTGLLDQSFPDKPNYRFCKPGNMLVICRAGRSRSVTLTALFLHVQQPERFATLDDAIDHVANLRGLTAEIRHRTPKPVLIASARWAADMARLVEPNIPPTVRG